MNPSAGHADPTRYGLRPKLLRRRGPTTLGEGPPRIFYAPRIPPRRRSRKFSRKFVKKSKFANRLKRALPKFRGDRSEVRGVNGRSKFVAASAGRAERKQCAGVPPPAWLNPAFLEVWGRRPYRVGFARPAEDCRTFHFGRQVGSKFAFFRNLFAFFSHDASKLRFLSFPDGF